MKVKEKPVPPYGEIDTDDLLDKLQEVQRRGFCSRDCPECGCEITRVEPDATSTWCYNCDEVVEIEPLI